ncbi:MAG: HAD-IA family hydrolase [SAR324 cluster bacterium]|nr:HAD-IA family hydrolase [SAR324 cluster bacterium]
MTEKSNIEALLFDLGGVVISIDFNNAFQNWQSHSRLSIDEIRSRFKMDAAYEKHERGEIDATEYFKHLRNVMELEGSDEEIAKGWNSIYTGVFDENLKTILSLKNQLPCFAFTNTNFVHKVFWTAKYPQVVSAFERIFDSSEMGLRKPEKAAFEFISLETGYNLSSILFFDDTQENIVGGREAGLQVVHVQNPSDVRRALSRYELL